VALELGGTPPRRHASADLDYAAERVVAGGFGYAGQSCISVQRVLASDRRGGVPRSASSEVGPCASAIRRTGPPRGPMIAASEAERRKRGSAKAVEGGARLLVGGCGRGPVLRQRC